MTDAVFVLNNMLSPEQVQQVTSQLSDEVFVDVRSTANGMAKAVKYNEQVDADKVPGLIALLTEAVVGNPLFRQLVMPRAVSNLMVSRYREGMGYGTHTDAAIMKTGHRSDISFTLLLNGPEAYEGGELAPPLCGAFF